MPIKIHKNLQDLKKKIPSIIFKITEHDLEGLNI